MDYSFPYFSYRWPYFSVVISGNAGIWVRDVVVSTIKEGYLHLTWKDVSLNLGRTEQDRLLYDRKQYIVSIVYMNTLR